MQLRSVKSEQLKNVGEPIDLSAKIIKMVVRGDEAWTAESTKAVRRIDLTVCLEGRLRPSVCSLGGSDREYPANLQRTHGTSHIDSVL